MNSVPQPNDHCAIDFGTSNSAVALPTASGVELVELEPGRRTMPTAVFYSSEGAAQAHEAERLYGRAAVAAYVDGMDGRLMRSMKSILGSPLAEQATDVGAGRSVRYLDVITGYLRHLKQLAELQAGRALSRAVLGRPVFFVDGEPERDARASAALAQAARHAGFEELQFQYEPIAAALAYESTIRRDEIVLVADIGGGTSDFSLVQVGPERQHRVDRREDILANHGVHVAGTDFDRRLELATILPLAGYGTSRPARPGEAAREVPSGLYFDLATWHLINTAYTPLRLAEWRAMRPWFADPTLHDRLLRLLSNRLGHGLAAAAERAKIDVATQGHALIDLAELDRGLTVELGAGDTARALEADLVQIVQAAIDTVRLAGVAPGAVQSLFFTGGSTGLSTLADRIAAVFPQAAVVRGDRFASVAQGLGLHARRLFSGA